MAKKQSNSKAANAWKRKKWYEIIAPKLFFEQSLGETIAIEPDMVMGRTAKINLMNLTKDIKKQNVNVTFKVNEVQGLKAHTEFIEYAIIPTSLKRLVRKGREKIEDSFLVTTKDERVIRLKPIIICRSTTSKAVTTDIKEATRKMCSDILKQIDYHQFVKDVITTKFQKALRQQISKIYPTRIVDIRMIKLIK